MFILPLNFISISNAGKAINAQKTKYNSQSINSTKNPDDPEKSVLGIDIRAVIKANCVAVNSLLVILAIKAKYALSKEVEAELTTL